MVRGSCSDLSQTRKWAPSRLWKNEGSSHLTHTILCTYCAISRATKKSRLRPLNTNTYYNLYKTRRKERKWECSSFFPFEYTHCMISISSRPSRTTSISSVSKTFSTLVSPPFSTHNPGSRGRSWEGGWWWLDDLLGCDHITRLNRWPAR